MAGMWLMALGLQRLGLVFQAANGPPALQFQSCQAAKGNLHFPPFFRNCWVVELGTMQLKLVSSLWGF